MTFIRKNRILFSGGIAFVIYLIISLWIITYPYSMRAQTQTQWNVTTLKEYVDQRFASQKEAVDVALDELKEKFRNTNEWRGSQDDLITTMQNNYVPKGDFNALKEQVDKIEKKQDAVDSRKQGGSSTIGWLVGAFGVVIALLTVGKSFFAWLFKPKT